MNDLKVALVTGAASGMGRISSKRLAAEGVHVAAVDVNEEGQRSPSADGGAPGRGTQQPRSRQGIVSLVNPLSVRNLFVACHEPNVWFRSV